MAVEFYRQGGGLDPHKSTGQRESTSIAAAGPVTSPQYDYVLKSDRAVADLTMTPPRWENHFSQNFTDDGYDENTGRWLPTTEHTSYGKENAPAVGEQGTLFSRQPGQVTWAMAPRSLRRVVPTMLGIAVNEHTSQWMDKAPKLPGYDDSLSSHSASMVQSLMRKGVDIPRNPFNPNADTTNDYSFANTSHREQMVNPEDSGEWEGVSEDDVKAGFRTVKDILRGKQFQKGS